MAKDQDSKNAWYDGVTPAGHNIPECSSAFQKSVRRSDWRGAVYFGLQLAEKYANYVWKRLRIMTVEDVGLANPDLAVQVNNLFQMWQAQMAQKSDHPAQAQLFLVQAILLTAKSPKSRMVDNVRILFVEDPDARQFREIGDYCRDKHTKAGKAMGRGIEHFIEEGSKLVVEGSPYTVDEDRQVQQEAEALMMELWSKEALAAKAQQEKPQPPATPKKKPTTGQADLFE